MDCGSPICILSDSLFREIGLSVNLDEVRTRIVGAEGSELGTRGSVVLDVTIQGVSAKQLFYVCYLRNQGCTLDFSSGNLYTGSNKVKLMNEPC